MWYAALLRGINVGRGKPLAMADLRDLLARRGYDQVTTYLRSGNAVFTGPELPVAELGRGIAEGIAADLGMDVKVLIRTGAQLAGVLDRLPLPGEPEAPSRFFVAFLSAPPAAGLITELEAGPFGDDRVWVSGSEAYLWCPNGAGDTPLTNSFIEKRLKVTATSRNWNTVRKLVAMTGGARS